MHATPGNFFDSLRLNPQISQETVDRYEKLYHLNDPLLVQYGHWVINILHGEWGYSFYYNVPVTHVLGSRLFNTFILSFTSLLLTWGIAIPLGHMGGAQAQSMGGPGTFRIFFCRIFHTGFLFSGTGFICSQPLGGTAFRRHAQP